MVAPGDKKAKPAGSRRARHQRWRRVSTWVTVLALVGFTIASISFFGSLSKDESVRATEDLLERIAAALHAQAQRTGALPETLDALQPTIASSEIVREDAYGRLVQYTRLKGETFELRSPGADGVSHTQDDIVWPAVK